ncbi:MAG: hypothetical protein U0835_26900 [Isosphaeraceae bacterium]
MLQPVDRLNFDAGRIAASRDGRYLAGQTGDTVTVMATETHLAVSTLGDGRAGPGAGGSAVDARDARTARSW